MLMLELGLIGEFCAWIELLRMGESSPNCGARNDVPHEPRTVRPMSSDTVQLKDTFGTLMPPTVLYWSWRHEPSRSSFLTSGIFISLLITGTFNWAKAA